MCDLMGDQIGQCPICERPTGTTYAASDGKPKCITCLHEAYDELKSLRTQLAAEIEKREKAEKHIKELKETVEVTRLIIKDWEDRAVGATFEKSDCNQRAATAEQALQKSEAEKVELDRIVIGLREQLQTERANAECMESEANSMIDEISKLKRGSK